MLLSCGRVHDKEIYFIVFGYKTENNSEILSIISSQGFRRMLAKRKTSLFASNEGHKTCVTVCPSLFVDINKRMNDIYINEFSFIYIN